MPLKLDVAVVRDRAGALGQMQRRSQDTRSMLRLLADEARAGSALQFRSSAGWAPLKAITRRRKGNQPLLVSSGQLREAMTRSGAPGSVEVLRATGDGGNVIVGTNLASVLNLQRGSRGMARRNPARLDAGFGERAATTIAAHLTGGSRSQGLGL